ncbi:hypothetical protein MKW92_026497, partial [Papaver armeniacum]
YEWHSWKDQKAKPKIKYFTQVKARPPTFVAFIRGKNEFSDTDIRFLTRSLKEDFDLGEFPSRYAACCFRKADAGAKGNKSCGRMADKIISDKRTVSLTKFPLTRELKIHNTNHLVSFLHCATLIVRRRNKIGGVCICHLGSKQAGRHISLMALSCVRHGQVVAGISLLCALAFFILICKLLCCTTIGSGNLTGMPTSLKNESRTAYSVS